MILNVACPVICIREKQVVACKLVIAVGTEQECRQASRWSLEQLRYSYSSRGIMYIAGAQAGNLQLYWIYYDSIII